SRSAPYTTAARAAMLSLVTSHECGNAPGRDSSSSANARQLSRVGPSGGSPPTRNGFAVPTSPVRGEVRKRAAGFITSPLAGEVGGASPPGGGLRLPFNDVADDPTASESRNSPVTSIARSASQCDASSPRP